MKKLIIILNKIPWQTAILVCLTLGLAPFNPPHVVEKLEMLFSGNLTQAMDWFDLFLHGSPWGILILKLISLKISKK